MARKFLTSIPNRSRLKKDLRLPVNEHHFLHQSFECSSQNREEIRKIFEDENLRAGYKKVAVAFSGHDHTNYMKEINGIAYIQINSASNQWVGEKCACPERFSDEINQKRPALKYTLPYKDALYGIVTLTGDGMQLKGVKSEFIAPVPKNWVLPTVRNRWCPGLKTYNSHSKYKHQET